MERETLISDEVEALLDPAVYREHREKFLSFHEKSCELQRAYGNVCAHPDFANLSPTDFMELWCKRVNDFQWHGAFFQLCYSIGGRLLELDDRGILPRSIRWSKADFDRRYCIHSLDSTMGVEYWLDLLGWGLPNSWISPSALLTATGLDGPYPSPDDLRVWAESVKDGILFRQPLPLVLPMKSSSLPDYPLICSLSALVLDRIADHVETIPKKEIDPSVTRVTFHNGPEDIRVRLDPKNRILFAGEQQVVFGRSTRAWRTLVALVRARGTPVDLRTIFKKNNHAADAIRELKKKLNNLPELSRRIPRPLNCRYWLDLSDYPSSRIILDNAKP